MLTDATALPLIAPATRNKLMHKPTHIHTHTHASQCAAGGALVWARAQTLEWVYGWMDGWQFYCEFAQLTKNFFMANKCFAFSPFFLLSFFAFFRFQAFIFDFCVCLFLFGSPLFGYYLQAQHSVIMHTCVYVCFAWVGVCVCVAHPLTRRMTC